MKSSLSFKILRQGSDSILKMHFIDSNVSVSAERIPMVSIAYRDSTAVHKYLDQFNKRKEKLNCKTKEWKDLDEIELPADD